MATTSALALAGLTGLLYFAAFPPLDVGVLGWVALAPLLLAVRRVSPARAALCGWLAGTIAASALTGPSIFAVAGRADRSPALALAAGVVVPQLYGAVWFALFAWTVARTGALRDARAVVVVPAAWVACELGRSRLGHACPWTLLAHSQAAAPRWLQLADVAGAAGPGFVLAAVATALALAVARVPQWRRAAVAVAATVAGAGAYGGVRLATPPEDAPALRVALVQADVPDAWRTSLARLGDVLGRYRALTGEALLGSPALVVWPENAVGVSPAANAETFTAMLARPGGDAPPLLVGAPRELPIAGGVTLRNSAWVLEAGRGVTAIHDKTRLAPFGEASPWSILGPLARGFGVHDVYTAADVAAPLEIARHRVGVLICFEAIYPEVSRALVRDGAELLINISNDAWFGDHAGVEQHFRAAILRAVETRRWLVRATNTGITAAVDPRGVVVATAPRDVPAVLVATPIPATGLTPWVRWGDWFAWTCVGICLLAMATTKRDEAPGPWARVAKGALLAVVAIGLAGMMIPLVQIMIGLVRGR